MGGTLKRKLRGTKRVHGRAGSHLARHADRLLGGQLRGVLELLDYVPVGPERHVDAVAKLACDVKGGLRLPAALRATAGGRPRTAPGALPLES